MARETTQWTLQIQADASKAKKEIQSLISSLNKVQTLNSNQLGISSQIREASAAAQQLKLHLQAATNVNTGQLNLVEFNKSIQQSGQSMASLMATLAQGGQTGQQAFQQMATAIANTQVPIRQANKLLTNMMVTLKNTVKWELSSMLIRGLRTSITGAVSYVKELNGSLNDIRIVTGKSVEEMARFTEQARIAAKELSTTTKAFTDASLIYFQQGDSMELAAKKAAITIKAANISFGSTASEMSEYLTAVWNSFQVGADELERYVDIMAQLGANTATSMEEIATSMQKVAATANTVGVSMEQVSAIISTVSSVTRESAESIGTAYKTIFARMGDLKLGETLEDGLNLGAVSSELDKIGVHILDANGELRNMGTIVEELMSKWQYMSKAEQTAIAQVVGGKRQYTQIMALMENEDKYARAKNLAENAEGTLQSQQDIHTESVEAAASRTKESIQSLYSSLLDDSALLKFHKSIQGIVDNITNLVKSLGGLKGILGTVGAVLMRTFSGKIVASMRSMGQSMMQFATNGSYASQYTKILKGTSSELADSRSMGDTVTLQSTSQLLDLKSKLLTMNQSLTASEQQQFQLALSGASEQIGRLNQVEQEYLELDRSIQQVITSTGMWANQNVIPGGATFNQKLTGRMGTLLDENKVTKGGFFTSAQMNAGGNQATNMMGQMNQLTQIEGLSLTLGQALEPLKGKAELTKNEINHIVNSVRDLEAALQGTKMEGKFKNFSAEALTAKDGVKNLLQSVQELRTNASTDLQGFTQVFATAINSLPAGELKAKLMDLFTKFIGDAELAAEILQKYNLQAHETENTLTRLQMALNKFGGGINTVFTGLSKVTGTMMSAVSGINMLSNGIKNATSKSGKFGDNLLPIISGLSMILSIVPVLGKSLSAMFAKVKASAGWVGWLLSAIAAVATITGAIIKGNKERKAEEAKEKRETATKTAQDQSESTIEEINNTKDLINNYTLPGNS